MVTDEKSKQILSDLGFIKYKDEQYGFTAARYWQNEQIEFIITIDRGYYEAFIGFRNNKNIGGNLIWTLRRILGDKNFMVRELDQSGRYKTFMPNQYVNILNDNYNAILNYSNEFIDAKLNTNKINYLNFENNVNCVNKFWLDVDLRYSIKDSLFRVVGQSVGSNLRQSIFKLGQNIGHSICNSNFTITAIAKDSSYIQHCFDGNFIVIKSDFKILKFYRGFLDSAESYQIYKIKNKIDGVFKDEIDDLINKYEQDKSSKIGYKTVDDILILFINSNDDLSFAAYKINTNYD